MVVTEEREFLVGEVTEEAALRDTCTLNDVFDLRFVVATLFVQLDRRSLDRQTRGGLVSHACAHLVRHLLHYGHREHVHPPFTPTKDGIYVT